MESEIWGIKILHGSQSKVPIQDNVYTQLTNVCLGEISGQEPTFVKATIETIQIEKLNESTGEAPVEKSSMILGVLTPNKVEQIQINQQYSPLNTVSIEASGPNDVYVSGNYIDISDDDEEEEEEEECAEESMDEQQLTKRLMAVVSKNSEEGDE
ncbi:hypothetical protein TRFO_22460 [Tritrichomonas foetus]|uniref:Nucleoplasmin-like domain-containing protein n=1 Tax=Tritrichomonas foetus TaxID=1144522 RepID=A0A1J4KHR6_9EUKA|nr:hypothetical protein TRFO_22460 [Tritrichomonas foetus]|eukprot:OHT08877.1 hypothetical protein TRFO_22460 [Tritrichomonas foetus]